MKQEEIFEIVKQTIIDEIDAAKKEPDKITMDASLESDLQADSLDSLEVVMTLQDKFDIEISDEDAMTFKTVRDIVDYIASKK